METIAYTAYEEAAAYLRERSPYQPRIAITLGSGMPYPRRTLSTTGTQISGMPIAPISMRRVCKSIEQEPKRFETW